MQVLLRHCSKEDCVGAADVDVICLLNGFVTIITYPSCASARDSCGKAGPPTTPRGCQRGGRTKASFWPMMLIGPMPTGPYQRNCNAARLTIPNRPMIVYCILFSVLDIGDTRVVSAGGGLALALQPPPVSRLLRGVGLPIFWRPSAPRAKAYCHTLDEAEGRPATGPHF